MLEHYFILLNTFVLLTFNQCDGQQHLRSPSDEFSKHLVFQPLVHHGRTRRQVSTTRDASGDHLQHLEMQIPGGDVVLQLQLQRHQRSQLPALQYQRPGLTGYHTHQQQEIEQCHYSGVVRGRSASWSAVSTCDGLRGVVFDGVNTWYIEPAEGNEVTSKHYLYDHRDLNVTHNCGHTHTDNGTDHHTPVAEHIDVGEDISTSAIRHKRAARKMRRYVQLLIVVDNKAFHKMGGDVTKVHSYMITIANAVNAMYNPLNIHVSLEGVLVWNIRDPIKLRNNALDVFAEYKYNTLVEQSVPHDNAQLLTGFQIEAKSDTIGLGYVDTMCDDKLSCAATNYHSRVLGRLASTMAHEMGHNFGLDHDDARCRCSAKECIMHPSGLKPNVWSECSRRVLKKILLKNKAKCLWNEPGPTKLMSQRAPRKWFYGI